MLALAGSRPLQALQRSAERRDFLTSTRTAHLRRLPFTSRTLSSPLLSHRHKALQTAAWFNQQSAEAKIEQTAQLTQEDDILESLQLNPEVRENVSRAVEDLGGKARHFNDFMFVNLGSLVNSACDPVQKFSLSSCYTP